MYSSYRSERLTRQSADLVRNEAAEEHTIKRWNRQKVRIRVTKTEKEAESYIGLCYILVARGFGGACPHTGGQLTNKRGELKWYHHAGTSLERPC